MLRLGPGSADDAEGGGAPCGRRGGLRGPGYGLFGDRRPVDEPGATPVPCGKALPWTHRAGYQAVRPRWSRSIWEMSAERVYHAARRSVPTECQVR
jgi:hypothetical protein